PATLLAGIGVSARWHPIRSGVHRLGLLAEVGGAIANRNQDNSSVLFNGGFHYQWRPKSSTVGLELSVVERVYWLDQ
ncbi:MAG TPA: hypothetical protein DCQ06_07720, partial [Myxococcales bacterium]|nr:hypothetical protein [Myxococcales bacterium]